MTDLSPETVSEASRVNEGATIAWSAAGNYDLAQPNPEIITLEDYAYALAYSPRFRGQTRHSDGLRVRDFYGVGQHCVFGAQQMLALGFGVPNARAFLFHESGEVPWGDFPGPGKHLFPGLRPTEKMHGEAINRRFGVETPEPDLIKRWDLRMYWTERRDLMRFGNWNAAAPGFEPFARQIVPYGHPTRAAESFLELAYHLGVRD